MRVVIVGAGLVGLVTAWSLHRSGAHVTLVDPDPAQGATRAAAGMLAPTSETFYREEALGRLCLAGAAAYPCLVADVAAVVGSTPEHVGYRTTPTLVVGTDAADRDALGDLHELSLSLGLTSQRLGVREVRRREPLLAPGLSCAFLAPHDHQVDPRSFSAAVLQALRQNRDDRLVAATVAAVTREDDDPAGAVTGVRLADEAGTLIPAEAVVIANGLGAAAVEGLGTDLSGALRPVHGDILRLRPPRHLHGLLEGTIRGRVAGRAVYVVPRGDGTVVLGATSREDGLGGVSAGGVHELLTDALRLVPALAEFELEEVLARARPGTPDNAPLLGRLPDPGGRLVLATGTYRNGILLAPVVAKAVTTLLGLPDRLTPDVELPDLRPFDPLRFHHLTEETR